MDVIRRNTPGAGHENSLVAIMFFAAGIVFLDRFGISYLFPQIGPEFGLSNSQLGALFAITALTWALSSLIFSILSDRLGGLNKPIVVASLVLFSVAVGFIGLAPNFGVLLVLRAVIGFCEGPALPLMLGLVAQRSTPERRGRNMGIVIAGTAVIGGALTPSIMVGLATAFGWRLAFPLVAVPGLLIALVVAVFVRPNPRPADGVPVKRLRAADVRVLFRNRNILLTLVGSIVCIGYTIGFLGFAPTFLASRQLTPASATLVLTAYGILAAIGNLLAPLASDWIGRKPALLIAAVCSALVPLSYVLFAHDVPVLLLSLVTVLMAGGALGLVTYVIPGESVPARLMATAFALELAVGEIVGGVLGPQIGGAIADATHDLADAMYFYAAVPVVLVIVTVFLRETAPRRTARSRSALDVIELSGEAVLP